MGNSFEISSNHPLGENFSNLPQLNQFEQTGEPKGNIWKGENVNLPFYSMNINEISNRWQKIRFSLNTLTKNLDKCESDDISQKVMEAIVKYCPEYERDPAYNFTNLLYLFGSYSGPENFDMNSEDLKQLLKKMIDSAVNLEKLITKPIPLLRRGMTMSLSFNTEQCASLLANCFFCTFPNVHSNKHLTNPNFIR